jgi:hypothetical protein
MALNMNKVSLGITQRLTSFQHRKNERSSPQVWVAYEDADGGDQYVEICPYGARTLSKALREMADLADPPPKPRKRRS